jgi:predicted acyltransferase
VQSQRVETRTAVATTAPVRLHGVDVARGLAVVGMLLVDNRGSAAIGTQLVHAPWHGLRLADVVFPVFLLLVGVSMPFSRRAHRPRAVLQRVAKLTGLGVLVLTAKYGPGTWSAGVLGHVAGAYLLCWLLLRLPRRAQLPTGLGVLLTLSALNALVPVPGVGRPALEPGASWAEWFDGLLGLDFGAEAPHTLLPSALTVYIGVLAGRVLLEHPGPPAVRRLVAAAAPLLAAGLLLAPALPLNKRLWTPSYLLVTGALALLTLATAHALVDVRGVRRPFQVLEVLGVNAIVAFVASELVFRAVLSHTVQPSVVGALTAVAGPAVAAWAWALLSVAAIWALCALLARRGVVVRV